MNKPTAISVKPYRHAGVGMILGVFVVMNLLITLLATSITSSGTYRSFIQNAQSQEGGKALVTTAVKAVREDLQAKLDAYATITVSADTVNGLTAESGTNYRFPASTVPAPQGVVTVTGSSGTLGTYTAKLLSINGSNYVVKIFATANGTLFTTTETLTLIEKTRPRTVRFLGRNTGDRLSDAILQTNLGDIDGDGFTDFCMAAPMADNGATTDTGEVVVVFGRSKTDWNNLALSSGTFDLDNVSQANRMLRFTGRASGDRLGITPTLSHLGDVNNDGYADFALSSRSALSFKGEVFLVFGRPKAEWDTLGTSTGHINLSSYSPANKILRFEGRANNQLTGAYGDIGDVNSDGFSDFVITSLIGWGGSGWPSGSITFRGDVYVVFGRSTALWNTLVDASGNFVLSNSAKDKDMVRFIGQNAASCLGSVLPRNLGDVNGDGYPDFGMGAPCEGSGKGDAYVVMGRPATGANSWDALIPTNGDLSIIDASTDANQIYRFSGNFSSGGLGRWGIAPAGDINKDGFDDLLIPGTDEHTFNHGRGNLYTVFGRSTANWNTLTPASPAIVLNHSHGFTGFPSNILVTCSIWWGDDMTDYGLYSGGRDLNRDGISDIIVGNPGNTQPQTFIIFGRNLSAWNSWYDEDGMIGLQHDFPSSVDSYGTNILSIRPRNAADKLNDNSFMCAGTFGFAGDVNGDGFEDLIFTAPLADGGGTDSGEVYVIMGRTSEQWMALSPTTQVFSLTSGNRANRVYRFLGSGANHKMGSISAAPVGDINADGYDDVLIGAPDASSASGQAYLITGRSQQDWDLLFSNSDGTEKTFSTLNDMGN
jgi:hypothetical protein